VTIAENLVVGSPALCFNVCVGFRSAESARAIARNAHEYAGGRVYIDAEEGLCLRSVPADRVEALNAALDRTPGADHAPRFRVPESAGPTDVFIHQGRLGVLVSAPAGSLSSEAIEGLAGIAERCAFDGMSSTVDGQIAILGVDPTIITEVTGGAEGLGLKARRRGP